MASKVGQQRGSCMGKGEYCEGWEVNLMNKVRAPALTIIVIQFEAFDFSLTLPQKKIPKYSLRSLHTRLSCWRRPCYFYVRVCEGFFPIFQFYAMYFPRKLIAVSKFTCVCVCFVLREKRKEKQNCR